jgi:hypothetical protein
MPNDPFVDVAALASLGPIRYLDARDQATFEGRHAPVRCACRSMNGIKPPKRPA